MKICILGSEGQIGKPLARFLRDEDVRKVDIKLGDLHDLRSSAREAELLIGDADYVFFLAFDVGGSRYLAKTAQEQDFISNNVKIMDNVFTALAKNKVPFLYVSSMMAAKSKDSNYGLLKELGERYVNSLKGQGVSVRLWNVFGEQEYGDKSNVITDMIHLAKTWAYIKLETDGLESRNFLHVDDCVKALAAIMDNHKKAAVDYIRPIHVFGEKMMTIREVASIISKIHSEFTGIVPSVLYGKEDSFTHDTQELRPSELNAIPKDLWTPKVTVEDAIRKLYQGISL